MKVVVTCTWCGETVEREHKNGPVVEQDIPHRSCKTQQTARVKELNALATERLRQRQKVRGSHWLHT